MGEVLHPVGFPSREEAVEELKCKLYNLMKQFREWIEEYCIDVTTGPENADIKHALQEGTYKGSSFEEIWGLAEAFSDAREKVRAVVKGIECFMQETLSLKKILHRLRIAGHPHGQKNKVSPLLGTLHRKHTILKALSFLADRKSVV